MDDQPSSRRRSRRPSFALWGSVTFAMLAAVNALRYLVLGPAGIQSLARLDAVFGSLGGPTAGFFTDFVTRQEPAYYAYAPALLLHIVGMSVALVIGTIQLLPGVRRRSRALHQRLGWIYALTAGIGSLSGAYIALALPMVGSRAAIAANVLAGVLGTSFVALAVRAAQAKDFSRHGRYMLRSYAVLTTLLTFYVMIPTFVLLGASAELAYEAAHDLCLPVNLLAAEVSLHFRRRARGVAGGPLSVRESK